MSAFTAEQRAELHAAAQQSRVEADAESREANCEVLLLPEAQPVILRIAAATDTEYAARLEHIARVATLVLNAKRHPRNAYAKPTLSTPAITAARPGHTLADGHPAEQTGAP